MWDTDPQPTSRPDSDRDALGLLPGSGEQVRTRVDPYPRNPWLRWGLRLLLALPYLVLVSWAAATGLSTGTENATEAARVAAIEWTRADVGWVSDLFPPVGSAIAIPLVWAAGLNNDVVRAWLRGILGV